MTANWPDCYLIHTYKSTEHDGFVTLIIDFNNGCCIRRGCGETSKESSYLAVELTCKQMGLIPPAEYRDMEANEAAMRG